MSFQVWPSWQAPGSKRCPMSRSGGTSVYFRVYFAKYTLLGILSIRSHLHFMNFQIWPRYGALGSNRCPQNSARIEHLSIYTLIFYWPFLTQKMELLPQFWPLGLEIFNIVCQWYEDIPQERIFGSNPHSRLQAQKGVSRVGLEALLLTLEHPLLNTSC